MENKIKKIIAKNLIDLRKNRGLTQIDLAEKLNYSDKTISKWENGDSMPDVSVLAGLAEFYGITLDELIQENAVEKVDGTAKENEKKAAQNSFIILCLSVSVVFLIATLVFVYMKLKVDKNCWQAFVWAVPVSCIGLLYFYRKENKGRRGNKVYRAVLLSVLVWSLLIAVYLQFLEYQLWLIFLVGVPIETIIWLGSKLNK